MSAPSVKPLPLRHALLLFFVPGALFFVSFHAGMPWLVRAGMQETLAYLLSLGVPLVVMFVAALLALRVEGWPLTWASMRERYRFRPMARADWVWAAVATVVSVLLYGGVAQWSAWLIEQGFIPVPAGLPAIIDPQYAGGPEGILRSSGGSLAGRWDLVAVYFVVLFFNIAGEELWWRGFILPRQELTHGRRAWVVHGLLWAAFHFFKWWGVLSLVPSTLALAFVCQRRKNSTPGFIIHYAVNGLGFVAFVSMVLGAGAAG